MRLLTILLGLVLPFMVVAGPMAPAVPSGLDDAQATTTSMSYKDYIPTDKFYKLLSSTPGMIEAPVPSRIKEKLLMSAPPAQQHAKLVVGVVCETSGGSPLAVDVVGCAAALQREKGLCLQLNPVGSKCSTLTTHKTASVGICGGFLSGTACWIAADWVAEIAGRCLNGGKIGGYVIVPSTGQKYTIFHS